MNLEKLKDDWNSLNESSEGIFTNENISTILSSKFRIFAIKLFFSKLIVLVIFTYFIALFVFRFETLEVKYLKGLAIVSIAIMTLLSSIILLSLSRSIFSKKVNHTPSKFIRKLARRSIQLQKFYLVYIISGFLLLVSTLILCIKIYNEFDLIQSRTFWFLIIPSSLFFMILCNRWISNSYSSVIKESKELLNELDQLQ